MISLLFRLCLVLFVLAVPALSRAAAPEQTAWRLLDYVAVDYVEAVRDGRVFNEAEYAEMLEFSRTAQELISKLPVKPARSSLIRSADQLRTAIAAKAPSAQVANLARGLARSLLAAYPVPLSPSTPPDLARGAALYATRCASCHGVNGDGKGPAAAGLDPPPIAFTDAERARQRSLFALQQVIEQGIDGTAMPSSPDLSSADRWALAFHVGRLGYGAETARAGERLWPRSSASKAAIPDLETLAQLTPDALGAKIGQADADAVMAYLRGNPTKAFGRDPGTLDAARRGVAATVVAYQTGDRRRATELALSAYLDGFEPVEPVLAARDARLMAAIESAMGELRAAIGRGSPVSEVRARAATLSDLFGKAEAVIAPDQASPLSSFLGAFAVLLREGLEALLIVVAIIAFLRKADRTDALRYVHGGWAAALVAGAATWWAATYLVTISGASREVTEGVSALFAALVLLSVGIWMHGKSNAGAWQAYIRDKLDQALSRRSAWFLFGLVFVVVYREVFETILFYAALWSQGGGAPLLAGAAAATVLLAVIAWLLLRYSRKLPIAKFFAWSSALIAVLAVVLAGKGIAALQEAGVLDVAPLAALPRVDVLGFYPTVQGLLVQLLALAVLLAGFRWNQRRAAASA